LGHIFTRSIFFQSWNTVHNFIIVYYLSTFLNQYTIVPSFLSLFIQLLLLFFLRLCGFLQFLQVNARLVSYVRSCPLRSISFQIDYLCIYYSVIWCYIDRY
jgi:hypothetical protein